LGICEIRIPVQQVEGVHDHLPSHAVRHQP
jgi:hypothetical protein